MDSRIIQLTGASLKYGNLNIRNCGLDFFPQGILGGPTRDTAKTKIIIHPLGFSNEIETDIPTDGRTGKPRWIFRERAWVKQFMRTNRLTPNAKVIITRLSEERYFIAPAHHTYTQQLFSTGLLPIQMQKYSDSMNSPFRYAGGKFYARKLILQHIPPHKNYCEPFAGGASIFFAKPKAAQSHLNDLDEELMRVYRVIRDQPEDLISFLTGKPATKELHSYYKNEFQPKTLLEKAARWYYLNRTSYSGIMNIQNCYWGYGDKFSKRPENWPCSIRQASQKLQGVKLTNYSFERAIEESEDGTFLFIDPPYFNADQDKFYTCSFSKEDHYRLRELLHRHRNRLLFLLTYDDCPEVRELYSWATGLYNKEWNYCINRTDDQKNGTSRKGQRYKGKELFILNYVI
ncbi:MAG: DNA adenine methylase [Sedimentisphaerales bacterium]|nr:DNA adenine methylase [Sedimentisphaerales bacterium]